jgi:hypothetical protein
MRLISEDGHILLVQSVPRRERGCGCINMLSFVLGIFRISNAVHRRKSKRIFQSTDYYTRY